jgi:hypothetical protein
MIVITFQYERATCHNRYLEPEVPEDSYGLFVMRTEGAVDAGYPDANSDRAFLES